ncbi:MAG: GNAT family N-acetyltransferase [Armatimonadetes bacterium]|nr:GNAT family N-acetyltransferase [Armatimonadota bacterium]
MAVSLRIATTPEDLDLYRKVIQVVYNRDEVVSAERVPLNKGELVGIAVDGTEVLGGFMAIPYELSRGEAFFKTGGIAAVGVCPEARTGGLGGDLMRFALTEMKKAGYELAALYAYRDWYYRKFGYEVVGRRWQVKCPPHRMPIVEQELPVRKLTADQVEELSPCYEAFSRMVAGCHKRDAQAWKERLGEKVPMIYAVGDPVEGYLWTHMPGGFWDDLEIGELVWSTRRGYESLLAFMRGLAINRGNMIWMEPSLCPILNSHWDQGMTLSLHRQAEMRIIDPQSALSKLRSDAEGDFSFEIEDKVGIASGAWKVRYSPAETQCERLPEGTVPDLKFDERSFIQSLMGEPNLADLIQCGRVHVNRPAAVRAALGLMTPMSCWCSEFF